MSPQAIAVTILSIEFRLCFWTAPRLGFVYRSICCLNAIRAIFRTQIIYDNARSPIDSSQLTLFVDLNWFDSVDSTFFQFFSVLFACDDCQLLLWIILREKKYPINVTAVTFCAIDGRFGETFFFFQNQYYPMQRLNFAVIFSKILSFSLSCCL